MVVCRYSKTNFQNIHDSRLKCCTSKWKIRIMRRLEVNSVGWLGFVFIITIISSKGTLLPEKAAQESGCFGINGDVYIDSNCSDDNHVMAIEDVRYGAKALADGCNSTDSNCCIGNSDDCSFRYRLDEQQTFCSGKKLCTSPVRVSQNAIQNTTCDTSIFGTLTQFIYMDYYCIPKQRIFDATNMTIGSVSAGMFAYLWNKNYGENNATINVMQTSDTYFACSVQSNSCNSRIRVFSVHVKLDDPYTICGQNITFFYENGKTYSINCTPHSIGLLFESSTPYIIVEVHNSRSANGGRFWLGFQASESTSTIYLNCPGVNQTCKNVTTEESVSERLGTTRQNVATDMSATVTIQCLSDVSSSQPPPGLPLVWIIIAVLGSLIFLIILVICCIKCCSDDPPAGSNKIQSFDIEWKSAKSPVLVTPTNAKWKMSGPVVMPNDTPSTPGRHMKRKKSRIMKENATPQPNVLTIGMQAVAAMKDHTNTKNARKADKNKKRRKKRKHRSKTHEEQDQVENASTEKDTMPSNDDSKNGDKDAE